VYTLSGLAKAEHVDHDQQTSLVHPDEWWDVTEDGNVVRATIASATASDQAIPDNGKDRVFNSVLEQASVEHGEPHI
jgi:hypothetical protein